MRRPMGNGPCLPLYVVLHRGSVVRNRAPGSLHPNELGEDIQAKRQLFLDAKTTSIKAKQKTCKELIKELETCIVEKCKVLKSKISKNHFFDIAQEPYKLKPGKLHQFIANRYGPIVAHKLQSIMDFQGPVDFQNFCHQMELILRDRNLMLQASFDAFDINNDDKISELDLYKIFIMTEKQCVTDQSIPNNLIQDVILVRQHLNMNWSLKVERLVKENNDDAHLINRVHYWRNL